MKNNSVTVVKEGGSRFSSSPPKEGRRDSRNPFPNRVFGGCETPHPKSHTPRCFPLWFTFFYPPSYIITPFSRGANRISLSLETRQGIKACVAGVHRWSMKKMEWGPSSKRADRGTGAGGEGRSMHISETEEDGSPRKGDDPLGVPRNPTSWYRRDVLPRTHTTRADRPFSIYHASSPSSTSCLVLSFFLLLRSA